MAVGLLLNLAAVIGAVITGYGNYQAFRAVDNKAVDPSQKAEELAKGIDLAMNATLISLVLLMVGSLVFTASLIWWIVTRNQPATKPQ